MNLLFYRYGSICEPDVMEGFQELGYQIQEITTEITNKELTPQESIQIVSSALFERSYQFVFSINFFPFLAEVCNIFKLPYLCWTVDSPVMELYATSISHPFNRVFLFDRAQYDEISPLNPGNVFHLPLAANVRGKQSTIANASPDLAKRFVSDISFVGSLYTEKCPFDKLTNPPEYLSGYLNGIMESQLLIYGGYIIEDLLTDEIIAEFKEHLPGFFSYPFESYLTDRITAAQLYIGNKISAMERLRIMELLSKRFRVDLYTASDTAALPDVNNRGLAKTMEEMPLIFNNSKINLNITSKSIRSGLPLRIFDILACGGFLMTNFQTELTDYFQPGEELIYYESMEDLTEKADYFLHHESQRKEIAQNGLETVRSLHTYPVRLEQMLHYAFGKPADNNQVFPDK